MGKPLLTSLPRSPYLEKTKWRCILHRWVGLLRRIVVTDQLQYERIWKMEFKMTPRNMCGTQFCSCQRNGLKWVVACSDCRDEGYNNVEKLKLSWLTLINENDVMKFVYLIRSLFYKKTKHIVLFSTIHPWSHLEHVCIWHVVGGCWLVAENFDVLLKSVPIYIHSQWGNTHNEANNFINIRFARKDVGNL